MGDFLYRDKVSIGGALGPLSCLGRLKAKNNELLFFELGIDKFRGHPGLQIFLEVGVVSCVRGSLERRRSRALAM